MTEAIAFKPIETTLRDGRHVRIRAIRPDDRDEVVQAFARLSSASRYTRCRRPVKLVYQETHVNRGAALRREAAIKALTRSQKLTIIRLSKRAGSAPRTSGNTTAPAR